MKRLLLFLVLCCMGAGICLEANARIADINGVFYVDGIKHTVCGDRIRIETTDPATRASVVQEIDYAAPMNADLETRGETRQQ